MNKRVIIISLIIIVILVGVFSLIKVFPLSENALSPEQVNILEEENARLKEEIKSLAERNIELLNTLKDMEIELEQVNKENIELRTLSEKRGD